MASNIPLFLSLVISILLMIGLPIFLAVFFTRRFKVSWWVVLTGVLTFIVAFVLDRLAISGINSLFTKGIITVTSDKWLPIVYAVLIGLVVALFEETARFIGFKILGKKAEGYGSAFAAAAGHGGIESLYLCIAGTAATLYTVLFYNPGAQLAGGASAEAVQYTLAQIDAFWTTPWHFGLLPGIERIIALSTHMFLSTLVWKAVADKSPQWFFLAVLYHMVVDAVAVFLQQIGWSSWTIEGILAIFMLLNLFMIYRFWKEESEIEKEMDELSEEDLDEEDEEDDDDDSEDEDEDESEEIDDDALEINHPEGEHTDSESDQE